MHWRARRRNIATDEEKREMPLPRLSFASRTRNEIATPTHEEIHDTMNALFQEIYFSNVFTKANFPDNFKKVLCRYGLVVDVASMTELVAGQQIGDERMKRDMMRGEPKNLNEYEQHCHDRHQNVTVFWGIFIITTTWKLTIIFSSITTTTIHIIVN